MFWSGDSEAFNYMVMFFFSQIKFPWSPGFHPSTIVVERWTQFNLKMWLSGVKSYCCELPGAEELACVFVCVWLCSFRFV